MYNLPTLVIQLNAYRRRCFFSYIYCAYLDYSLIEIEVFWVWTEGKYWESVIGCRLIGALFTMIDGDGGDDEKLVSLGTQSSITIIILS